ncbi:hypothetical protein BD289DRAFT_279817 [Coniella lustricola]|uniref:Uncharacterized protein n=1 Tax=Coniella lustricola TaxID=2025994 RepID=A0A2T3A6A2_9PEZI|nr:hypothetical protein BD289DRAFT_279817 [Coniella lustricola]
MAPVHVDSELKYTGAALVALHFVSVVYFTRRVVTSLYHSSRSLTPSQDVRHRLERRKTLVPIYSGLAVLSLLTACYATSAYAKLSYKLWADERGIGSSQSRVDQSFTGTASDPSVIHKEPHLYGALLDRVRWLAVTPVYQDAFEIVAEKARRFWWAQQADLALIPWSVFLATEGSRRGISHLFAFLSLAHLVNLSFAQNLFFIALLLTPAPLPQQNTRLRGFTGKLRRLGSRPKPLGWALKPGFLILPVLACYGSTLLFPGAAETGSIPRIFGIYRALTFAPLVLQNIAPRSWGTVHSSRKAESALIALFKLMAVMSFGFHGISTFKGLRYNVPHAHYHRHSKYLPWDIEERSRWERTTTALGKLLGSTGDHPLVAGVGYDVLISGLSLGLWAAVRSLRAEDILTSVAPLYRHKDHKAVQDTDNSEADDYNDDEEEDDDVSERGEEHEEEKGEVSTNSAIAILRSKGIKVSRPRRRRPSKARTKGRDDPAEDPNDKTYQPTPGEQAMAQGDTISEQEVDLEAAALTWGLMSVGGLAFGGAGVFGGESLAS